MKAVAIIQARAGGTRLPGKVLQEIGDRTVLRHIVGRVECTGLPIVVAIPDTPENDRLAFDLSWKRPFSCWRGSEADVLSRFWGAAIGAGADYVVRITADCPFVDPRLVLSTLALAISRHSFARTDPALPRGLDVEAFPLHLLAEAATEATSPSDREHVCPWITRHRVCEMQPAPFAIPLGPRLRWTLDTPQDLAWFRQIATEIDVTPPHPTPEELLALLDRKPELRRTEADYARETAS